MDTAAPKILLIRRWWLALTCVAALVGCGEGSGPGPGTPLGLAQGESIPESELHPLQQGPGAPQLETYQISFWTARDRATSVTVNYLPASGTTAGDPFLWFQIPQGGLVRGAGGSVLGIADSVQVTLTIDPVTFEVRFEPSGVRFNNTAPATLQMWFHHSEPDLNGDGVIDAADEALCQQLSFWYSPSPGSPWTRVSSTNDLQQMSVLTALYHFSGYAVSW